jgi:LysR family transcriptional activator of nhaA
MEWLNYHHLLYFWVVAKEGSITRASRELRLAHPTISGQIHRLEEVLGLKLFDRKGRNLVLTDSGRVAFRYADEIFSLGGELLDTVRGRATGRQLRLTVGVSDALAKSLVYRILKPAFDLPEDIRIVCRENRSADAFLGELVLHEIDVILSDTPAGPGTSLRTFNHLLGECGTTFLGSRALSRTCRRGFPRTLGGTPIVLPGGDSTFRRALNEWFAALDIRPKIVAELDDAALAQTFGGAGLGVFAVPDVVAEEIRRRYGLGVVGHAREIRQRFFAIALERKIKHPAVAAICDVARKHIFA